MNRHRNRVRSVPTIFRLIAWVLPLSLVATSLFFQWPDKHLEGSTIAVATLQLALGSMLAWSSTDVFRRTRRRRQLIAAMSPAGTKDVCLSLALGSALTGNKSVVLLCDDDDIGETAAVVRAAARTVGFVSIECPEALFRQLTELDDVDSVLSLARSRFIFEASSLGFRDSELHDMWFQLLRRQRVVMIVRTPGTLEARPFGTEIVSWLRDSGLRFACVGSGLAVDPFVPVVEFDTVASRLASGHMRLSHAAEVVRPLHGVRPLANIIGDRRLVNESIRAKLQSSERVAPSESSGARDEAAGALIESPEFFSETERRELVDILQFSSRGLRVLSGRPHLLQGVWNPVGLGEDTSSLLALKRKMCLAPGEMAADDLTKICEGVPRSWLLDIISSLRAHTQETSLLLLRLAQTRDVVVRYAAATQFVKTLTNPDPTTIRDHLLRSLGTPVPVGFDDNLALGALGWVLPRLVATWPEHFDGMWSDTVTESITRDPTHLSLSIARGILLIARDHPGASLDMAMDLRRAGPRFWLTDVKIAHAAAKTGSNEIRTASLLLDEGADSAHPLVSVASRLAREGNRRSLGDAQTTWGLEMLEAVSTLHAQEPDTLRLKGRVVLAYGRFLESTRTQDFGSVIEAHRSDRHGVPEPPVTEGLPRTFVSESKKSEIRLGPVFCFSQAKSALSRAESRAWLAAGARALESGSQTPRRLPRQLSRRLRTTDSSAAGG